MKTARGGPGAPSDAEDEQDSPRAAQTSKPSHEETPIRPAKQSFDDRPVGPAKKPPEEAPIRPTTRKVEKPSVLTKDHPSDMTTTRSRPGPPAEAAATATATASGGKRNGSAGPRAASGKGGVKKPVSFDVEGFGLGGGATQPAAPAAARQPPPAARQPPPAARQPPPAARQPPPAREQPPAAREPRDESPRRPIEIICYLCGRKFGSRSIGIHEPQCLGKWRSENAKLPPQMRRKTPTKPEILKTFDPSASRRQLEDAMDAMGKAAYESFQQQLCPCPVCGRRFAPDRLIVHQRSCK